MYISSCGFNPHFIRAQRSQVMIGERSIVDPLGRTIRPVIRLADNAPNFQGGASAGGDGHSRPVVDFTMTTASNHPTEVRVCLSRPTLHSAATRTPTHHVRAHTHTSICCTRFFRTRLTRTPVRAHGRIVPYATALFNYHRSAASTSTSSSEALTW
jgi:hypothetical protein